jgi:thioredoxin-related protein
VLSGGELEKRYSKDFVVFEASSPHVYPEGHELRKLTSFSYTPVFVFLDSSGKKVAETQGFRSEREAKALHEFVTTKAYRKTSLREFLATYPPK